MTYLFKYLGLFAVFKIIYHSVYPFYNTTMTDCNDLFNYLHVPTSLAPNSELLDGVVNMLLI